MPMNKATSITIEKTQAALAEAGRALFIGLLMALPLCGLVLFFEMTRPAKMTNSGFFATQMASAASDEAGESGLKPWALRGRQSVARFKGVSAQRRADKVSSAAQVFNASDAQRVLAEAPSLALKAGFYTEFLTKERHRISLLVLSREPILDQALPDNTKLMNATEASTANVVSFAWGRWIYRAEIEDKGLEPDIVVQKVL
jgi:hypothetical protein